MAKRARLKVKEKFSIEDCISKMESILAKII